MIQGYTAVAAVDAQSQIIVAAQAHGSGSEQSILLPMIRHTDAVRAEQTLITADAGYHSEDNLRQLHDGGIPALIADALMRRRDSRFKEQAKYKSLPDPLYDKTRKPAQASMLFQPKDFHYDPSANTCLCPAGKQLYSNGSHCNAKGHTHHKFTGAARAIAARATCAHSACVTPSVPAYGRWRFSTQTRPHRWLIPSA